jgi:YkoY family integral membrane protein
MVRHLGKKEQKRALMYGLGGAFVLRTLAIVLAASIIKFWWLQLIGAGYLMYLPIKHFISYSKGKETQGKEGMGFWPTVVYLNLVDLAFALDSVVAAVAVVDTVKNPDKLWVVVAGAIIGIVLLRFAASFFIRILEKYPVLDHVAYLLVGWAGLKLLLISGHSFEIWLEKARPGTALPFIVPEMNPFVFWGGMALISIGGTLIALRHPAEEPGHQDEVDELDDAMRTQIHLGDPRYQRQVDPNATQPQSVDADDGNKEA